MYTILEKEYMEAVKRIARELSKPNEIDWEQRRYQIAKDCLAALFSNPANCGRSYCSPEAIVKQAVYSADLLVAELKQTKR